MGDETGPANKYSYNLINPNRDNDISVDNLIKRYPELRNPFNENVFKFLPYTKKEDKFYKIDAYATHITDDIIETAEDYWMFIEAGKCIYENEWKSIPKSLLKDAIIKYASVASNFNIPDNILNKIPPSDRNNYLRYKLRAIKLWADRL